MFKEADKATIKDPEYVRKTTDYNEMLLDAVIAGTSRRRRTKQGSLAPTSTEPLDIH